MSPMSPISLAGAGAAAAGAAGASAEAESSPPASAEPVKAVVAPSKKLSMMFWTIGTKVDKRLGNLSPIALVVLSALSFRALTSATTEAVVPALSNTALCLPTLLRVVASLIKSVATLTSTGTESLKARASEVPVAALRAEFAFDLTSETSFL